MNQMDIGTELTRVTNRLDAVEKQIEGAANTLSGIEVYLEAIASCIDDTNKLFPKLRIKQSAVDNSEG